MGSQKLPFKRIEIPLSKINDELVPYHVELLRKNKASVDKLKTAGTELQMSSEVSKFPNIVKQIKDIIYELDNLRAQVENHDLDKFDAVTITSRKMLTDIKKDYTDMINSRKRPEMEEDEDAENDEAFLKQLKLTVNIEEVKLQDQERRLQRVDNLRNDIEDLNTMYCDLGKMVSDQGESVDKVENNIQETAENVSRGANMIAQAAKYKASAYPVTGALVGTCIGGPIGMVAGFKLGCLAGLGCAILGYGSGRFIKKRSQSLNDLVPEHKDTPQSEEPIGKKKV